MSVIAHHGVLGQKWGVRRFQPYPDGYHGKGKFVGEDSEGNKITKRQYKKNKKELKKDINNLKNAYDESKVRSERFYNKYNKEYGKYSKRLRKGLKKGNMDYKTMIKEDPERGINYKEYRRYNRIANNIADDLNHLYVQYRQEYGKKMEFDKRGSTGDEDYKRFAHRYLSRLTKTDLPLRLSNARFHAINGVNLTKPVREILEEYDSSKQKK